MRQLTLLVTPLVLVVLLPSPGHTVLGLSQLANEEVHDQVEDRWQAPRSAGKKAKFIKTETGCPCWFNLTMTSECACCENNAIQCGYPKHNECQRDRRNGRKLDRKGCDGVDSKSKFTLSTTGYPCPWDPNDRTCAWCSLGGKLVINKPWANSNNKGYCVPIWDNSCIAIAQDCRIEPNHCDINADCLETGWQKKIKGYTWKVHRCVCKPGFTGNGIQCANDATGLISPRQGVKVDLTMKLTTDIFEGPAGSEDDFPHGPTGNDLMTEIDDMLKHGPEVCGAGCNATVVHCGKEK